MANVYSNVASAAGSGTASLDNTRRVFNFGERVAELAPQQSPFFVYLSKVAKKPTNDPVFKFLEQRHQWQRRNFEIVGTALTVSGAESHAGVFDAGEDLIITAKYDQYGKISSGSHCQFILPGQILAVKADSGVVYRFKIAEDTVVNSSASTVHAGTDIAHMTTTGRTEISGEKLIAVGTTIPDATVFGIGNKGQVIGSAWAEGTDTPLGWEDKMYDREGY